MNNDDFKEVTDTPQDTSVSGSDTNTSDSDKDSDYEDICYICRRPESVAGKMIHIPGKLSICHDCLQKTFNAMTNMSGFSDVNSWFGQLTPGPKNSASDDDNTSDKPSENNNDDKGSNNFTNLTTLDLEDISNLFRGAPPIPENQKLKKRREKKKKKKGLLTDGPVFDIKNIPPPHKIKAALDQYVIGQEKAKKILSVAVYNHYKRVIDSENLLERDDPNDDDIEIEKSNILMIGPTGSGKTYMVKTLAKLLDVPLAITDATTLTEAGYIGDDIESVVSKLLAAADNNVEEAEHGIIFIDEIDKLAKKTSSTNRDINGESVQQGMLKLLEGAEIEVPVGASSKNAMVPMTLVDTTNILFICGGAFPRLTDVIKERLKRSSSIGFVSDLGDEYDDEDDLLSKVTPEDLRKFGFIPEFIGRLPIIATLQELSKEMLINILTKPKNAIIKQYKKLLSLDEVDLEFDRDALEWIAGKAQEKKLGARALRSIIEEYMMDIMYEIPKDPDIGKVTITRDYLEHKGGPKIEMRGDINTLLSI
ncbi:MAG: ATP-dependent Clp protease ATP-binding subunit ClpX [Lachnospiraceae bacterium]|uniref:ATP-dependent Clp protease ATP-binding subunit ClpX n=1 Tax=Candidatus Weimeria bifida TaxID=2599074 RepID=A0A6N7J122_9FIRM|nr:ATP-dependent Clp protease ATP-binding subunit ClpX [Candidatus Weimeria bifida]RRF96565.1 MAG: ATP-dependent Clp protease ATP-binding subunit ClpX [Lachnospiraceae bacterium]